VKTTYTYRIGCTHHHRSRSAAVACGRRALRRYTRGGSLDGSRPKPNVVRLVATCDCGERTVIPPIGEEGSYTVGDTVWRVRDGFSTDAGTSFPTEVHVRCPRCKTETMYLG
jgi:hypothetical protein